MKRQWILLLGIIISLFSTGCVQEKLVIPVATVTGKVVVPSGLDPLGIMLTVAANSAITTYVSETGTYKLEFTKPGRYLLVARSRYYDVDYAWVDALMETRVSAPDIVIRDKIVCESKWIATIVDFPDATKFRVKSIAPQWATQTVDMYDDGTHDDKFANDGIFTLRLANLATGYQDYMLVWSGLSDGEVKENEVKDPHQEGARSGVSEIYIREAEARLARGRVTSALTGVNYSEVTLATKGGARKISLNSDGTYDMPMDGSGREYLVFRSTNFDIRAVPVNLTTVPLYDVPDVILAAKTPGRVKLILVKSDFLEVVNPMVVADFTGWQPEAMYDDATHGDEAAGDGVYTYTKSGVAPGYHKYAFNLKEGSQVRDPYEESGDSQYSIISVK